MTKFTTNATTGTWWPKLEKMQMKLFIGQIWDQHECRHLTRLLKQILSLAYWNKALPEAQRTQVIDCISRVISKVEMKISCRDKLRYRVSTLGLECILVESVLRHVCANTQIQTRSQRHSDAHSWKKCFCLREPVFCGSTFLILRLNFPNFEAQLS